jgi:hypothetical protein
LFVHCPWNDLGVEVRMFSATKQSLIDYEAPESPGRFNENLKYVIRNTIIQITALQSKVK